MLIDTLPIGLNNPHPTYWLQGCKNRMAINRAQSIFIRVSEVKFRTDPRIPTLQLELALLACNPARCFPLDVPQNQGPATLRGKRSSTAPIWMKNYLTKIRPKCLWTLSRMPASVVVTCGIKSCATNLERPRAKGNSKQAARQASKQANKLANKQLLVFG